jgi:hypothetical protein
MPSTYNCTSCQREFGSKSERDNHVRRECESSIQLTNTIGNIQIIERMDRRFACPKCQTTFTRTNNLKSHWIRCKNGNTTQGTLSVKLKLICTGMFDDGNDLVQYLRYDGSYNLAVCVKCEYSLPMEWIEKHFKDHHKIKVTLL